MVVVRGVNVYPAAVENLVRSCNAVSEYRVTVTRGDSMAEILIEVECRGDESGEDTVSAVRTAFETSLGLRPEIVMVQLGTLPRLELKARRFFIA